MQKPEQFAQNEPEEEQQTCGKGLAENSVLPANLSELITALTENLELHMKALDVSDQNGKQEYAAYDDLAREFRDIATRLSTTAKRMAGCKDLPMGGHDEKVMSDPKIFEAFKRLINVEHELMVLLQKRAEQHQQLLAQETGDDSMSASTAGN